MSDSAKKPMIKNNKVYDTLKYIAQIVLPAVATLYYALSQVWGFTYGPEVVGTITAIDTFLGVFLGVNTYQYRRSEAQFDGSIDVYEDEGVKRFTLDLDEDPYSLEEKGQVTFKVNKG